LTEAIFTREGDVFVPTEHARGPWDPDAMHGGAPTALLARAIERLDTPVPMRCTRLSVEFARAVPLTPVTVDVTVVRGGKRLALAEAVLRADGADVLRARATLLRAGEVEVPAPPADPPIPGPEAGRPAHWTGGDETAGFHLTAIDLRFARGDWGHGPALGWFRLQMPIVAGEATTPLQRAVAFADFGNGLSRALDFHTHLFVNTDLTVHLHREPVGEWVALDARTDLDRAGIGQAVSVLHDERGRIGVAAQSLFVDGR
jgi:Thioesterase-like superfamily